MIHRESFNKHLGELSEILDRNMKRRFLNSAPSLEALKEDQIEKLIGVVQLEHFKDKQYIIKQVNLEVIYNKYHTFTAV